MSETSTSKTRTEEEILAELAETRALMTATVDELFGRVQPEYLVGQAKRTAKEKALECKERAKGLLEDARSGDPQALKTLGIAAAGTAAVVALVLVRIVRGRR